ncbi:MAG TPA: hypothetical protein PKI14_00440 [Fervidobacterium sp.]|nr:hypothetical protein [Fervidobacterium sp.]HOM74195.1 hypothetical protein [Fervidobacterium sp.]HPP17846.1 hypothetical protein [Fervidobacterium sp.]HPZ16830.1 hypothetical protein [Fervidobacterium sp.]HQE47806.1 hypothetical protein [Fervidobacterium sp.]
MGSLKHVTKFLYIAIFLLTIIYTSISFGETLYFNVSPFDTTYGLNARYNFTFWKFNVEFNLDVSIGQKRGVPFISPDFVNMMDYFEFVEFPYKVTYSIFNDDIPFTTFINPASKAWHSTWLRTGYYGDYLIHQDDFISIVGNADAINTSFKTKWVDIFVERIDEGFNLGVGKNIYVFFGERTGIGGVFSSDNFLVYASSYTDSNAAINFNFGLSVKIDNFEMNIIEDAKTGRTNWSASWKVGDIYVTGRCKGEEVRLALEFPIW